MVYFKETDAIKDARGNLSKLSKFWSLITKLKKIRKHITYTIIACRYM